MPGLIIYELFEERILAHRLNIDISPISGEAARGQLYVADAKQKYYTREGGRH